MKNQKGVTLIELVVVISIITILLALATLNFADMQRRYAEEAIISKLHRDIIDARVKGMTKNIPVLIELSAKSYRLCQDTNRNDQCEQNEVFRNTSIDRVIYWDLPVIKTLTIDNRGIFTDFDESYCQTHTINDVCQGYIALSSPTAHTNCIQISKIKVRQGHMKGNTCEDKRE